MADFGKYVYHKSLWGWWVWFCDKCNQKVHMSSGKVQVTWRQRDGVQILVSLPLRTYLCLTIFICKMERAFFCLFVENLKTLGWLNHTVHISDNLIRKNHGEWKKESVSEKISLVTFQRREVQNPVVLDNLVIRKMKCVLSLVYFTRFYLMNMMIIIIKKYLAAYCVPAHTVLIFNSLSWFCTLLLFDLCTMLLLLEHLSSLFARLTICPSISI